jgi:hypothetical protein
MRPRLEIVGSSKSVGGFRGLFVCSGCSLWLPNVLGAEVDDVRDDS